MSTRREPPIIPFSDSDYTFSIFKLFFLFQYFQLNIIELQLCGRNVNYQRLEGHIHIVLIILLLKHYIDIDVMIDQKYYCYKVVHITDYHMKCVAAKHCTDGMSDIWQLTDTDCEKCR